MGRCWEDAQLLSQRSDVVLNVQHHYLNKGSVSDEVGGDDV